MLFFSKLWLGLNELWNIDLIIQVVFEVVWKEDKTVVNIAARILFFFNYVYSVKCYSTRARTRALH